MFFCWSFKYAKILFWSICHKFLQEDHLTHLFICAVSENQPSPLCQAMLWALAVWSLMQQRKISLKELTSWCDNEDRKTNTQNDSTWQEQMKQGTMVEPDYKQIYVWCIQGKAFLRMPEAKDVCWMLGPLALLVMEESGLLSSEAWVVSFFAFLHQPCSDELQTLVPSNGDFDWVHRPSLLKQPFTLLKF